jgi:uncharacterized protein
MLDLINMSASLTPELTFVVGAILLSSFVSGLFGSAGGALLIGSLLLVLDVAPAMIIYGVNQLASSLWRTLLWHRHIVLSLIWPYMIAALVTAVVMRLIAFVPDKAVVYISLGALPFLVKLLPAWAFPHLSRPSGPFVCDASVTSVQMIAGGGCGTLELFFQNSDLNRKQIVASKAAIQTGTTILRVVYFGSLFGTPVAIPLSGYVGTVLLTVAGTSAAALILMRMSDADFRRYTRLIISGVGVTLVGRGIWLVA